VSTLAEVRMWGSPIGAVSMGGSSSGVGRGDGGPGDAGGGVATFQYSEDFLNSGIEVSPLTMPLRPSPYTFGALNPESFHGLPGLLADSLPDRYGHALIDAWLAGQGRAPESFDSVERLCYVGRRGMGALEFLPARGPKQSASHDLQVAALVELASEVLSRREELVASLAAGNQKQAMLDILSVGASAGGARAKAVIAWNPTTETVRSGQVDDLSPGFEHWLLKFDGVANNRDKDTLADPQGYGAVEYAYSLMARDAGIAMSECRLLEENGRRHFMTRRFDRGEQGKRHMQSLGAIAHFDYNRPGAHSYEQAFMVIRRLGCPTQTVEQMFRRMAFNVVARNQDDHVKNIAFLMDRAGRWELAPAFDLTYAYRPGSRWTAQHQMAINGKRDDFTLADFEAAGRVALLPGGRAGRIVAEVAEVLAAWPDYAERAGVDGEHVRRIAPALRLSIPRGA
jgi:serine/threonine-protein kinase HipA